MILHTDNALFGIILYDRDTFSFQLTLQAIPHHTATHRSECSFSAFLLSIGVSPTEVELPLRLVLSECEANFHSASQHTHLDAFNCF